MEQEVLGLVIGGNTNREIAATMRLSDTTVRDQINSILNKVETICRAQVAAYVVRWQIQRVFQYRRRESTSNTLETITGWEYNYLPPPLL
jgi:DNA-binding CsgD family transcriptional regulator